MKIEDTPKTYLIYTKNSKKPVEVFQSYSLEGAVGYFKQHPQSKYCGLSAINDATLKSVKTGADIEFNRLRALLKSIKDGVVCL